jgi:hypothetical protein
MTRRKLSWWIGGLAALGLAVPVLAGGNTPPSNRLYSANDVIEQAQPRPPEQAVPKGTESVPQAAPAAAVCEAEAEQVGALMSWLQCTEVGSWLDCAGIKVGGWMAQGFTWNPDSPDNRFNFPMTFNDRSNEYQLNQLYLYAERAVNTESCNWDIGGRVDILYGTDYYFTTAVGLETNLDGTQNWNSEDGPRFQAGPAALYGIAMPQAYAEIFAPIGNGVTVKAGHFYTPVGYETVTSTGNFFYSHAITHQYFEPFTHTGVLASYPLLESLKVQAGTTLGWDTFNDPTDQLGFLGGLTWTSGDTTLFYGVVLGEEPGVAVQDDRFYQSIVLTQKLADNLTSVTGSDLIYQDDGSTNGLGAVEDAEAYSIYQYLLYDVTDCLSAGIRFEWARDDDNLRVIPIGGSVRGTDYFSLTTGLNWKPCPSVRVRPELRWDWSNFDTDFGFDGAYDDFSDKNQFTASFDVIWTF